MNKIGLYGGAFDPVHNGHISLAQKVVQDFNLDHLIFIPCNIPPHKDSPLASNIDRFNMLEIAISDLGNKFSVSNYELQNNTTSYTYNTISYYQTIHKESEIYFITGSDIFATIEKWYNYKSLFDIASFIVAKRAGMNFKQMISCINMNIAPLIEKKQIILYNVDIVDVSSSEIRHDNSLQLVPQLVFNYIKEHKLYEGKK